MDKVEFKKEEEYLFSTTQLVDNKLNNLEIYSNNVNNMLDKSNNEYFDYLSLNSNKINENDVVELVNMQTRLENLQDDTIDIDRTRKTYLKMLDKPYFASIDIQDNTEQNTEKYYIGIHSLVDDNKSYRVIDWRSPIASIFYDYEKGQCRLTTNSSILECELLNKRQFGITDGKLNYYIDSTINIEDSILQEALAKNTTNQMKSIVETIQKEQNEIIRGDENKTLIVQGVAGSGKTAIALHRIAYLLYKLKGRITSKNIVFLSPNNAFSSYISSVLPDLAEDDIDKMQLDTISRDYLKKHLIMERKYEQIERLISTNDFDNYVYKTSYRFVTDLLAFAQDNYINNFKIDNFVVRDQEIDAGKIQELFFGKYKDRDLFTRFRWITDNVFDTYFYKVKTPEKIVKLKEMIFMHLYDAVENKNCVRAYMNFLKSRDMKLELVGDKVKNEDAYGVLFFRMFIYGLDNYENVKHLVIDEMQDYSALQLYIIDNMFGCTKTILGDYNQTINPMQAKKTLEDFNKVLSGEKRLLTLNKSYRSTEEIAHFYNYIGGDVSAQVVARKGEKVDFFKLSKNIVNDLTSLVSQYKTKNYNSIAIITKDNSQAKNLYSKLKNNIEDINLIDDNIDLYDNGICIISAYNCKGLEFDGVIVYNVSDSYSNDIDRNILYIASTRPLHKLTITYIDKKSKFIENYKEKL